MHPVMSTPHLQGTITPRHHPSGRAPPEGFHLDCDPAAVGPSIFVHSPRKFPQTLSVDLSAVTAPRGRTKVAERFPRLTLSVAAQAQRRNLSWQADSQSAVNRSAPSRSRVSH